MPEDSDSASDFQDYIEYIKNLETLPAIPSTHLNINRTNNRLVSKKKKLI